jgi:hypothetical protein
MFRIDDATAATSLPAPETAGTEGFFTEGNPATGTPATKVRGSWLNMIQEELCAILAAAGNTRSKTSYNQVNAALQKMYAPLIGQATNLKCVTTAVGTSLPYSADQLIVGASLGGQTFCLSNFSAAISALDTGTLAANSFYAVYAYLKSDGTKGGFLQLEPAGGAPTVYGGANPPANMIASALIGVWPTNASAQFVVASQTGRKLSFTPGNLANGSGTVAFTSISAAALIPKSAKTIKGGLSITLSTTGIATTTLYDQSAAGATSVVASANVSSGGGNSSNFSDFPVLTPQTLWYAVAPTSGTVSGYNINLSGYEV